MFFKGSVHNRKYKQIQAQWNIFFKITVCVGNLNEGFWGRKNFLLTTNKRFSLKLCSEKEVAK